MNKFLFLLAFLMYVSTSANAQNYNATAFNTNGREVKYLFPKDSEGNIKYSEVVNIKGTTAQIMEAVKTYIAEQKGSHDLDVKEEVASPRKYVATIVYPINKQYWSVEIWGSSVVSGLKDASRITFKCTVDVLDGKYRYILDNFWTDNRRIVGEAKDNGETNTIYAQRLNSLTKERESFVASHPKMSRKDKEALFDIDSNIEYEQYQYQCSYDAITDFIEGLKNLSIGDSITDFDQLDNLQKQQTSAEKVQPLDISGYHGNLMAKGNNVYVVTEGLEPYEQAGASELIKQIKVDGNWTVVPNRKLAHFVLEYKVNLEGRDHAYVTISDRDGKTTCTNLPGLREGSSESLEDNHEVARKIYLNALMKIPSLIEQGKTPKQLSVFER